MSTAENSNGPIGQVIVDFDVDPDEESLLMLSDSDDNDDINHFEPTFGLKSSADFDRNILQSAQKELRNVASNSIKSIRAAGLDPLNAFHTLLVYLQPLIAFFVKELRETYHEVTNGKSLTAEFVLRFLMTLLTIGMYDLSPSGYFDEVHANNPFYRHDGKLHVSRKEYSAFIEALTRRAEARSKESIDSDDSDDEEALYDRPAFRRDAVLLKNLVDAFCPAFGPLLAAFDSRDKYTTESPLHITVDDHQVSGVGRRFRDSAFSTKRVPGKAHKEGPHFDDFMTSYSRLVLDICVITRSDSIRRNTATEQFVPRLCNIMKAAGMKSKKPSRLLVALDRGYYGQTMKAGDFGFQVLGGLVKAHARNHRAAFTHGQSISSSMREKGIIGIPTGPMRVWSASIGPESRNHFQVAFRHAPQRVVLFELRGPAMGKMAKTVQFVPQIELNVNLRRMVRGDSQSVLQTLLEEFELQLVGSCAESMDSGVDSTHDDDMTSDSGSNARAPNADDLSTSDSMDSVEESDSEDEEETQGSDDRGLQDRFIETVTAILSSVKIAGAQQRSPVWRFLRMFTVTSTVAYELVKHVGYMSAACTLLGIQYTIADIVEEPNEFVKLIESYAEEQLGEVEVAQAQRAGSPSSSDADEEREVSDDESTGSTGLGVVGLIEGLCPTDFSRFEGFNWGEIDNLPISSLSPMGKLLKVQTDGVSVKNARAKVKHAATLTAMSFAKRVPHNLYNSYTSTFKGNLFTREGSALEPSLRDAFPKIAQEFGGELEPNPFELHSPVLDIPMVQNSAYPLLGASVDGLAVIGETEDNLRCIALEFKVLFEKEATASSRLASELGRFRHLHLSAELTSEDLREGARLFGTKTYFFQCLHHLAVLGIRDLAFACFDARKRTCIRIMYLTADQEFLDAYRKCMQGIAYAVFESKYFKEAANEGDTKFLSEFRSMINDNMDNVSFSAKDTGLLPEYVALWNIVKNSVDFAAKQVDEIEPKSKYVSPEVTLIMKFVALWIVNCLRIARICNLREKGTALTADDITYKDLQTALNHMGDRHPFSDRKLVGKILHQYDPACLSRVELSPVVANAPSVTTPKYVDPNFQPQNPEWREKIRVKILSAGGLSVKKVPKPVGKRPFVGKAFDADKELTALRLGTVKDDIEFHVLREMEKSPGASVRKQCVVCCKIKGCHGLHCVDEHKRQGYDVRTMCNTCLVPLCQIKRGNSAYTCFELWHKLHSVSSVTKASVETFLRSPRSGGSSRPVDSADRTAVINERTRMNKKARRTLSPVRRLNLQDSS